MEVGVTTIVVPPKLVPCDFGVAPEASALGVHHIEERIAGLLREPNGDALLSILLAVVANDLKAGQVQEFHVSSLVLGARCATLRLSSKLSVFLCMETIINSRCCELAPHKKREEFAPQKERGVCPSKRERWGGIREGDNIKSQTKQDCNDCPHYCH